tara:strand:+ start:4532 stop:7252 length:2721 start_codon:yes stop_codon:yes gene_type:complete
MNSLFGGGNFPNQPTSSGTTVATSEFPKELAPFIKDILEKAQSMQSGATYQPYTGAQIAPFNALEKDAMTGLEAQTRGLAGTDVANASQYFTGAKSAIEGLGQQFTGDTVQQFMNPYQQAVTDQAKLKATEDYEAQQNVLSANAIKNQPFGGSRQAITEGMAQGDYLDRLSNIQERGLAAGFTQGRAGFEAQKGRELQMANSLMGMGATVPQQAYRDLGIRQQIGETQRSQDQMALDLGTKQFMEEREFPTRALQEYSATVRGFPFQPSTYQTTTNYQPSPGIGQQLVNLAGQGLGGYTAFTGNPMQNLFKAEGGITTLPTYYNQRGENRQRSMYDISDLLEAEGGELDQYSDMEMDAMDIESYIDRKNKENLGDKILNMLYAPQRGMKRLFNVPERSQIGNRNRPNLNRAEGGLTGLPVVHRFGGGGGEAVTALPGLLKTLLGKLPEVNIKGIQVNKKGPEQGPPSIPMKPDGTPYTADEINYLGEQQMYPELEGQPYSPSFEGSSNYVSDGAFMEDIPYNEEGGYPLMGAATSSPDEGIPGVINPLKDPANQIVNRLIPQRVYKDELQDYTNVPLETLPNIESFAEQGADYGNTIAESVTKTDLLNKLFDSMNQEGGSIPGLKQSIIDAFSPARLESLRKTADSNLAMKQGLGMMKAFSKSDPTRGIISNLSSQVGDFATNVGPGQDEYASALAGIENMPFEQAQAIYNIDKDSMVNLGKLASDESLTGDKINFEALSADKKNLLDLINLKYTKSKDQALINQETNKINLLADLQSDDNILKLYQMELTTNDNLDAAEAAMGKYNKDLVKAGVLKPSDSEEVRKILMKTLFGAQIDSVTGDINMPNDKPLTMEQRKLYDQYYPMAIHDLGLSRMNVLYGVDKSDLGFSRVQLIANKARDLQTNQ